jgi:transcriptional regulator with XRE-family HTH domain
VVATLNVGSLGEYIREQRKHAQYSLRQLAEVAGVSNPYLSQIERGLKKPSAEILQQIARGLRISAETLYVRAGFLDEHAPSGDVVEAVLADPQLDDRQKRVLLDVYASFRAQAAAPRRGANGARTAGARRARPARAAVDKPRTNVPTERKTR